MRFKGVTPVLPTIAEEEGEMREAVAIDDDWHTQAQEQSALMQRWQESVSD